MDDHTDAEPGTFDARWWEGHYRAEPSASSQPSLQLVDGLAELSPGRALDAGCGTGADAVWLAGRGWQVTAVDISPTAVDRARQVVAAEPDLASRITWVAADVITWQSDEPFDLVVSQYVHPDLPFSQFVASLARHVGLDGTLVVVGHDHADTHSAAHAPQDASIAAEAVTATLDPAHWTVRATTRARRAHHGSAEVAMADVVVTAHRSLAARP